MVEETKRGAGRPPKTENDLMVRVNVTLPLSTARKLRQIVPEKQRSRLINQLLEQHFKAMERKP